MNAITLGMTSFKDGNGINAIICSANGVNSPLLEFSNLELGIVNGSTLGGYFQIVNDIGSDTLTRQGHFGLAWR
jgi:hypothetical protein